MILTLKDGTLIAVSSTRSSDPGSWGAVRVEITQAGKRQSVSVEVGGIEAAKLGIEIAKLAGEVAPKIQTGDVVEFIGRMLKKSE